MTNNRSVEQHAAASAHKHSTPCYISPALFNNRRLKQKRLKWAPAAFNDAHKTEAQDTAPTLTINLLSDEDEEPQQPTQTEVCYQPLLLKPISATQPPPLVPLTAPLLVYQQAAGHAHKLPHIALIPMHALSLQQSHKNKREKRARKARLLKRHAVPTLVNHESIVLSDDSEAEAAAPVPALPELTLTAVKAAAPKQPAADEEVTVSLVPRCASASSASSSQAPPPQSPERKKALFPMLPDETTVHTVIKNRIYELSLSKLREGLVGTAAAATPHAALSPAQPAPISLKLSSDLSISLISDEEEQDEALTNGEQARLTAEKLRRQQPQLSVQQLHVVAAAPPSTRQPPKRRKLG